MRTEEYFQNLRSGHINDTSPGKRESLALWLQKIKPTKMNSNCANRREYSDYELSLIRDLTLSHQHVAYVIDSAPDRIYRKRQSLGFKYYKDTKTWLTK